jgi:hypothetical protein
MSREYGNIICSKEEHMSKLNALDSGQGLLKSFCEHSDDFLSYIQTKSISPFAQQPSIQE